MRERDSEFFSCPLPFPSGQWRGFVTRTVDGDTIVVKLDHGFFDLKSPIEFRFASIDAWEDNVTPKQTAEQTKLGIQAADEVRRICEGQWVYLVTAMDREKYGRILGDPYVEDERGSLIDVCAHLHDLGLVKTWLREDHGIARLSSDVVHAHRARARARGRSTVAEG